MEHANVAIRIIMPVMSIIIVYCIMIAKNRNFFIRRIQGLTAIDEAIGRATEMGRPMVATGGLSVKGGIEIVSLQALSIITYVIRASARFSTRTIVPVYEPQMLPVTQ